MAQSDSGTRSLDELLSIILDELIRSRLRNRALLSMLVQNGTISRSVYVERYQAEEADNFEAISDMLLASPEAFREKHGGWLEQEQERYGFTPSSFPSVAVAASAPLDSHPVEAATVEAATKKPKRKRVK